MKEPSVLFFHRVLVRKIAHVVVLRLQSKQLVSPCQEAWGAATPGQCGIQSLILSKLIELRSALGRHHGFFAIGGGRSASSGFVVFTTRPSTIILFAMNLCRLEEDREVQVVLHAGARGCVLDHHDQRRAYRQLPHRL